MVGHGLTAAEDMTQLRNAGRTLAIAGYQPARILEELARLTDWVTSGKFATVATAIIEPDVSVVTYATAGHPPILIRRAKTGTVEIPPPTEGPALCLPGDQDLSQYSQGQTGFEVGDIMLMYTDGLIERRGEDLEDGINRVAERLQAWPPGVPLGRLCDDLIACLGAEPQLDDMCVLAVARRLPAGPAEPVHQQRREDADGENPGQDHDGVDERVQVAELRRRDEADHERGRG